MINNKFHVVLNTIDKVKRFIEIVILFEQDIDIVTGRYVVDAKSILGIFSIDLTRPMDCVIHTDDEEICEKFRKAIKEFII